MLEKLTTEGSNPASSAIETLSALEIVRLMNAEDARVAPAVGKEADAVARCIELIADRLRRGGRLIYVGAGTSGRLGVLDAAECPPTFRTPPEQVVGLIAGGPAALTRAVEGAEDHPESAVHDLKAIQLTDRDVVAGIATSGRTPYVLGGLEYARSVGATTIGISCNPPARAGLSQSPPDSAAVRQLQLEAVADVMITPVVGPEVITGSTRLKAGTATKMVLNMLTTGAMVLLGKTYGNLMVDLRATNQKLHDRSRRIVRQLTGLSDEEATRLLDRCAGEVKTAIVVHRRDVTPDEARALLQQAEGHLRKALDGTAETAAVRTSRPAGGEAVSAVPRPAKLSAEQLVIGVEGGGSKTVACIALREPPSGGQAAEWSSNDTTGTETAGSAGSGHPPGGAHPRPTADRDVIGRGIAGGSNLHAVGFHQATANLDQALQAAWDDAGLPPQKVAAACLALAGVDREEERTLLKGWAEKRGLARNVDIVNDAVAVLTAGTPGGWGVALIAGTGSFAWGRSSEGKTARTGGWGYLMGDEGSGFAVALAGLQAAARAADGRGPQTILGDRFQQRLGLEQPEGIIGAVYHPGRDRKRVASLAEVVTAAAEEGDPVALQILQTAAKDLAELVVVTARKLGMAESSHAASSWTRKSTANGIPPAVRRPHKKTGSAGPLPLALTGGLLLSSPWLRNRLCTEIAAQHVLLSPIVTVDEPIMGTIQLARREI